MSSSKAPKTPDYTSAAIAQGQSDKEIAQYLTQANRVNQIDPYGQTTWTQAADPEADAAKKELDYWQNFVSGGAITDGRDRSAADVAWATSHQLKDAQAKYNSLKGNGQWTQTTTLTPEQQKLLNQQQFIGSMQNDRIANLIATTKNPTAPTLGAQRDLQQYGLAPERTLQERQLNIAQMSPERQLQLAQMAPDRKLEIAQMGPARELQKRELEQRQMAAQRTLKDPARNDIQDLLYKQITKQYGDRFAKEEASQRAQLANQGFQSGSEGFSNQLTDFNRERNSAYEDAAVQAALASYDQTNKDRALNQSEYGLLSADDLNRYNAQTSNDLNRFNSLSANDLGQFNALTSSDLNRFNSQTQANLGNFNALTSNDLNRFNSQNTTNLNAFNAQNSNDLNRFQAQTTANLGNFGAQTAYDLDRFNSQSSNDLSRFGALNADALNRFSALSSDDLNRYNSQLSQYNTDQGFLSQLLGGVAGPTNPQYQPFAQATPYQSPDLLGAMQGQYQGNLNRTNARNASNSSNMQTAGAVASAAAIAF